MFSEQTNGLIEKALSARESTLTARQQAREKAEARNAAAQEEAQTQQALQQSQQQAQQAREAALRAITEELNVPQDEAAAALQGRGNQQQGQRPAIAGLRNR